MKKWKLLLLSLLCILAIASLADITTVSAAEKNVVKISDTKINRKKAKVGEEIRYSFKITASKISKSTLYKIETVRVT